MTKEEYERYKSELVCRLKKKLNFWSIDHYIGKFEGQAIKATIDYVNAIEYVSNNGYNFIDLTSLKHYLQNRGFQWQYVNSMLSTVNDFNKHFYDVKVEPEKVYVKTEDRIVDVTYWNKDMKGYYIYLNDNFCAPKQYIYEKDIVKEANDILLLLDTFIITDDSGKPHHMCPLKQYDYIVRMSGSSNAYAKGAIFTSKGIKYAAEINHKGELKLIEEE